MSFGRVLDELLKRHKISQRQLAKWSGLHFVTINRFCADIKTPDQPSVQRIADCYAFTSDEQLALFRTARCVPDSVIQRFAESEEFARECLRSLPPVPVVRYGGEED